MKHLMAQNDADCAVLSVGRPLSMTDGEFAGGPPPCQKRHWCTEIPELKIVPGATLTFLNDYLIGIEAIINKASTRLSLTLSLLRSGFALGNMERLPALLKATQAPGGLLVYVGDDFVKEAAEAVGGGSFLAHGLYRDQAKLAAARSYIAANGLAGKITVSGKDEGTLFFAGNVVNLLISGEKLPVAKAEVMRTMTPRGEVLAVDNGKRQAETKPVPSTIDDWTHNLYDAGNTGVSSDLEARLPCHMQWSCDPPFSRSHDGNSSILTMVSAAVRPILMIDEGSTAVLSLPSKWHVIVRDAFNGKLLWRQPLPQTLLMQLIEVHK